MPKAQADSVRNVPPQSKGEIPQPTPRLEDNLGKLARDMLDAPAPAPTAEPTKAPEPKPADPAPAPAAAKDPFAVELPETASKEQKGHFATLKEQARAEVNRLNNERATLAKELETYKKATPADTAEVERIRTELKSAQDKLAVFDVSSHPDFQRQYSEPKKKALTTAETLLTDNAIEGAPDVKALLNKPRNEFAKAVSEAALKMPLFDQAEFTASMREARRLHEEEGGALSKAGELRASIAAKAAREARDAFESSKTEFATRVPLMDIPADASEDRAKEIREYNQAREVALAEAEKFTFGAMTERQVADVATRAAALNMVAHHTLPMLQKQLAQANEIIRAQNEQLSGIASKKKLTDTPGSAPQTEQQPKSLAELTKKMFPDG